MGMFDKFGKGKKDDAPTTMHPTTIMKPKKSKGIGAMLSDVFGGGKQVRDHKWETTRTGGPATRGENTGGTGGTGQGPATVAPVPVIGSLPLKQQYQIVGVVTAVSLMIAAGSVAMYSTSSNGFVSNENVSKSVALALQFYTKDAQRAVSGDAVDNETLTKNIEGVSKGLSFLNPSQNSYSSSIAEKVGSLDKLWAEINTYNEFIMQNKNKIAALGSDVEKIRTNAVKAADLLRLITISANAEKALNKYEFAALQKLTAAIQRINVEASSILISEGVTHEMPFHIFKDLSAIRSIVSDFEKGNEARGIRALSPASLNELVKVKESVISEFDKNVFALTTSMLDMQEAKEMNLKIAENSTVMNDILTNITVKMEEAVSGASWWGVMSMIAFVVSLLFAALGGLVMTREARRSELDAKRTNDSNQMAVMRLLNEMSYLAEGDLTQRATTTDNFTVAIADSVNLAIDELRNLVVDIQHVSTEIHTATSRADEIAVSLAKASEEQAGDIMNASKSVVDMSRVYDETTGKMRETADLAEQSVTTAEKGSQIVFESIKGMRGLEGRIEETKGHVQRLNQNSESISEIVELISDITELTSVLAVNATIEASRAGDYGKGFSVVAKSVQDLAGRAAEATRKIGALVDTVRTDIQTVVSSIELTVADVKENAVRSDVTGEALVEIQEVSMMLADEIRDMQARTNEQSAKAMSVAEEMQKILELTNQTKSGTRETFESVDKIAKLAQDLNQSASRFKV